MRCGACTRLTTNAMSPEFIRVMVVAFESHDVDMFVLVGDVAR